MTTITIGWTITTGWDDYSPFLDGWKPGALQHVETIEVDFDPVGDDVICEAVFIATNAPYELDGLAGAVRTAIKATGWNGYVGGEDLYGHYSISVGDTVSVNGHTYACASVGWHDVTEDYDDDYTPAPVDPMDDIPWGTPDSWIPDNPNEDGFCRSDFI